MKRTNKSASGTSFWATTIRTTVNTLERVLGVHLGVLVDLDLAAETARLPTSGQWKPNWATYSPFTIGKSTEN